MASLYAPPPFLTVVGGAVTTVTQPQVYYSGQIPHDSSPPRTASSSSSIIIVIIIIASAIIVSASVYLLLRFFSRRFHRSFRTFSATDDVVSSNNRDRHASPEDLFASLPLFTFGSVTGKLAGGDCAVCLSKFEPADQLRLLPLCCHAFHARCIDTWLSSNQTCPLCRSAVNATEADVLNKILTSSATEDRGNSFRIEIGSISRRRATSDSGEGRRSYSIGSFEYIVEDEYEVSVGSTDKDFIGVSVTQPEPPGDSLATEVVAGGGGGRSWLREYVDRFASISVSSRALSFRSSGRFFTGSSRRSDAGVSVEDLEANRIGEEISELFRWLSGV